MPCRKVKGSRIISSRKTLNDVQHCVTLVLQLIKNMRAILNISMPAQEKKEIEKRAKKAKKTISGYVLYALKLEQSLIQEEEIVAMATEAEQDYKKGKTKKLKSLADLM